MPTSQKTQSVLQRRTTYCCTGKQSLFTLPIIRNTVKVKCGEFVCWRWCIELPLWCKQYGKFCICIAIAVARTAAAAWHDTTGGGQMCWSNSFCVGSAPLHNIAECLPWQYVQNGTPGSDKGFEPLPDKTKKEDRQNAKGLIKYLVAEPSGSTPLTTKSVIRHNPEQVSSNHYHSIYVWHSSEYYFSCSRFPRGCFGRDCAIKILHVFLVSFTSLSSRHKGAIGKQLDCKSGCNYPSWRAGRTFCVYLVTPNILSF